MTPPCYACEATGAMHTHKGMPLCCECYGCESTHGIQQAAPLPLPRPWWPWWCVAVVAWSIVTYWLWR